MVFLAAILGLAGCAQDERAAAPSIDPGLAAQIDSIVDRASAKGFGGQLVIMKDGAAAYDRAAGFADVDENVPVTKETLFQVSSMTKFFTAVLALKAVEDGELRLDDDAAKLFAGTPLAARDFTLREILDHRSGLRSTYAAESESDKSGALVAIAKANMDNVKDGEFHYSNDAYDALAIALERVYGRSYESLFREKIAAPAGLSHFAFWGEADVDDPNVRGQPLTPTPDPLKGRNYGMVGSAGLMISAGDLARFRRAIDEGRILGPAMLAELNAPREKISIGSVLYGAFLVDTPLGPALSARGAEDWGDNSYLNAYPDCNLIVAVVTSRGPAENSGKPLFRDQIIKAAEQTLAPTCGDPK